MTVSACRCNLYEDIDVDEFDENSPVNRFTQLRQHPAPQWWLYLAQCCDCRTYWLVAQEERLNDVYVIARLGHSAARRILEEDSWPETFQTYAELLRIGRMHGYAARLANHLDAVPICKDLIAQDPSIAPENVARLLNVSVAAGAELLALAKR